MNYSEILKVWNNETPDDFAIFSELYYEMFGEKNTLWDHLDRMSDTPMAEEVYGGW